MSDLNQVATTFLNMAVQALQAGVEAVPVVVNDAALALQVRAIATLGVSAGWMIATVLMLWVIWRFCKKTVIPWINEDSFCGSREMVFLPIGLVALLLVVVFAVNASTLSNAALWVSAFDAKAALMAFALGITR